MARLVLTYENDAHALKIIWNLAAGWRPYLKGHGFFGLGFLGFSGDVRVQVSLQVHARPNEFATFVKEFPRVLVAHGGTDSIKFDLANGTLEIFAYVEPNLVWLPGSQKLGVNWRPDAPLATVGPIKFYQTLLVSFTMPRSAGPGVTWEHDLLPFLSGGQFESNRRRH